MLGIIQQELDAIEAMPLGVPRLDRSEAFLRKHIELLSDDHHLLTAVRHSLISMYGRIAGYTLPELTHAQLEHKIAMCRRVLAVLDAVHPGQSRARALMLYELHAPLVLMAKHRFADGEMDAKGLRDRLAEAAEMLLMTATVLGWEAPNSAVAAVSRLARSRRVELLMECEKQAAR